MRPTISIGNSPFKAERLPHSGGITPLDAHASFGSRLPSLQQAYPTILPTIIDPATQKRARNTISCVAPIATSTISAVFRTPLAEHINFLKNGDRYLKYRDAGANTVFLMLNKPLEAALKESNAFSLESGLLLLEGCKVTHYLLPLFVPATSSNTITFDSRYVIEIPENNSKNGQAPASGETPSPATKVASSGNVRVISPLPSSGFTTTGEHPLIFEPTGNSFYARLDVSNETISIGPVVLGGSEFSVLNVVGFGYNGKLVGVIAH